MQPNKSSVLIASCENPGITKRLEVQNVIYTNIQTLCLLAAKALASLMHLLPVNAISAIISVNDMLIALNENAFFKY